jgi:Cu/Ag efflux protein CusF
VTLDHDAIKGFLCAMEMMFQVKGPDLSRDLRLGDVVDFKFDAEKYST